MTAERWARIKEVFSAALEAPEADRGAYLESACGGDAELRREVERLLADHATATLHSPAAGVFTQVPALASGEMLAHYRVETKLGEGGMGAVYRAYDTRLERRVAVKVLLLDPSADPDQKQRLMREARAASALNHPNIVTVYEIGTERGLDFIAMEYVEGRSLDKLIPTKGLPARQALEYAVQIAEALAQAHAAGIVHRDLKPANVMVNEAGRIKLLDFGLARRAPVADGATATLTLPGHAMGTPAYMSPEQAEGKQVDRRTDVFSFGSVLYEMLAGRRAFAADTAVGLLAAILHQEPRALHEVAPGVPGELERLVALCLRKNPAQRLAHVADLRLQLEGIRLELDSVGSPPMTGRLSRRRRIVIPAFAVAGIALLAAGGFSVWRNHQPTPASVPEMTRLTSDAGLTHEPAISPDGKLVAYSSDRGGQGNLDIWVQQVAGGDPIQLTRTPADESQPAFSADSSHVAFRSKGEGGGIYVVPALGGEPRLIAPRGKNPQFSPEGGHIAFGISTPLTAATAGEPLGSLYVVPSGGGRPRRLRPDFVWASYPIWTPDGRHLLFAGALENTAAVEWWVTPLDGGPAVNTGAFRMVRQGALVFAASELSSGIPKGWIGDSVICSSISGDGSSLWRVPISTRTWRSAGAPQRLTFGAGMDVDPSVSSGGRVIFAGLASQLNLWQTALDANTGRVIGEMQPLTSGRGASIEPALTADGRKLAFISGPRTGRGRIQIMDLDSGKKAAISAGAAPFQRYPAFSPDGTRVAFVGAPFSERVELYVVPAEGGVAEKICEGCGLAPAWSSDGSRIAYDFGLPRYVGLFDLATGRRTRILSHPKYGVLQPQISPDGGWIAFALVDGPWRTRLMIARFDGAKAAPESDWIPVTGGSGFDVRPRWSPDGNLLYFTSDRDRFRCIWAVRLDPATKRPLGPVLDVHHLHNPRLLLSDPPYLGFSVARDKMAFNLTERTGNLWMFQLPEER